MAVLFQTPGNSIRVLHIASGSSAETVFTMGQQLAVKIEAVNIAAGSGANASVILNDGTTDYPLLNAKAISSNTTEEYTFANVTMKPGDTLKVTDSGSGNLTFAISLYEVLGRDLSSQAMFAR